MRPRSSHQRDDFDSALEAELRRAERETRAAFEEGVALERQGKFDEEAAARIDARLRNVASSHEAELRAHVARIASPPVAPSIGPLTKRHRIVAAALALFFVVGLLLEVTLGSGFVLAGADSYRTWATWVFVTLILVFGPLLFWLEKQNRTLQLRYPTGMVRWVFMFPLLVVGLSGVAVVSPLGWAALAGWVFGSPAVGLQARIHSIKPPSASSKSCDQYASLTVNNNTARICIEGRTSGAPMRDGETVQVTGRTSRIGVFVSRIERL